MQGFNERLFIYLPAKAIKSLDISKGCVMAYLVKEGMLVFQKK